MLKIDLSSNFLLRGVIHLIFEKALDELKYSSMYAQLCKRLSTTDVHNIEHNDKRNNDKTNNNSTFLNLLLSVCQHYFNNRLSDSHQTHNGSNGRQQSPILDEEERQYVAKQKMLGNVKFIGELFKLQMLQDSALHKCITELLHTSRTSSQKEHCENMECLSQLIRTCGKLLDTEKVCTIFVCC